MYLLKSGALLWVNYCIEEYPLHLNYGNFTKIKYRKAVSQTCVLSTHLLWSGHKITIWDHNLCLFLLDILDDLQGDVLQAAPQLSHL